MTKHIALVSFTAGLMLAASVALAQEPNITFPIAELGGCSSKEECKTYCDTPANAEKCLAFAEANGLMSREETAEARKFAGQTGPGGCMGSECRMYCSSAEHRDECYAFAKEHGLTPPAPPRPNIREPQVDEDRAMRVVEEQGGPGGCRTKEECHTFCEREGNMEQCLAFAAEHGLMSAEDLEHARKMLAEGGPGGCKGMQCRDYCENPEHSEECLEFAERQGFIEPEEAEKARKLMNATGPGGCRGIECKSYCEDPTHRKDCFEFAVENDLISEEEAARVRQFMEGGPEGFGPPQGGEGFGGPGGCSGPEECRRYCTEHPEECQGFGPPPGDGRDFGQDRAIEMREFEIPPGAPCSTPEECRAHFESNPGEFRPMGPEGMRPPIDGMQYRPQGFPEGYSGPYPQPGMEGEFRGDRPPGMYPPSPDGTYLPPGGENFQQPGTFVPSPDGTYLPSGDYPPPTSGGESYQPPPEPAREPTSQLPVSNLVASVFSIIAVLFGL